jgi:hypothetical protein
MEYTSIGAEQRCHTPGQPIQLIQRLTDIPTRKRGLAGTVSSTAPFNDCQSLRLTEYRARVRNDTDRKNEVLRQTYHSATLSTTNTTWTGCALKNVFNFFSFY